MKERKLNWKKVLNEISNYAPRQYTDNYNSDHPLIKRLKITPDELLLIMSFLKEQGFIEYKKSDYYLINLTSKGLDVAFKVQNQRLVFSSNLVMAAFTAIIAFISFVNLVNSNVQRVIVLVVLLFIWGIAYLVQNKLK
ncbi:MAG: hypothetical protein MUP16_04030 [Sedimentisphaerales bacterium]|nr:hypothetical protein [Sedimentisphaerales bacterium]